MVVFLSRIDSRCVVEINGQEIPNVIDYKISSSMQKGAELEITVGLDETFMEFSSLTKTESLLKQN